MSDKIEKLTPEQEALLPVYYKTYLDYGLSCEDADRARAEPAFNRIYELYGFDKPEIIWVNSPHQANILISACEDGLVESFDKLRELAATNDNKKILSNFPSDFKPQYKTTFFWGQQDLYWVAFYKFCEEIGVKYADDDLEKLNLMDEIGKSCMWFYVFEKAIIACNRAKEIHLDDQNRLHNLTGPAISFRDGWKTFYVSGVKVPEFVVMNPETITVSMIEQEENTEVRRIMTQQYGYEKYLIDSGAEVVHELPENYLIKGLQTAKLLVKERKDDTPVVMVDCLNSTAEPDGTVKRYMIRVEPGAYNGEASKNVHAAMASTWRKEDGTLYFENWQDYKPQYES
jgi:hypothetical protein